MTPLIIVVVILVIIEVAFFITYGPRIKAFVLSHFRKQQENRLHELREILFRGIKATVVEAEEERDVPYLKTTYHNVPVIAAEVIVETRTYSVITMEIPHNYDCVFRRRIGLDSIFTAPDRRDTTFQIPDKQLSKKLIGLSADGEVPSFLFSKQGIQALKGLLDCLPLWGLFFTTEDSVLPGGYLPPRISGLSLPSGISVYIEGGVRALKKNPEKTRRSLKHLEALYRSIEPGQLTH